MATRTDSLRSPALATAPSRRRSARGEGDRLRNDLLEAAAELMSLHGDVEAVSLRAVARHAGVSPTAVYRHFDDHVDLLRESAEFCWANFERALREARQSSDNPFVAFRAQGDAYIRFALEHTGQYRVLFSNKIDLAPANTAGLAAFQLLVDNIAEMLRALDDDRDALFVAFQAHTWIHGIVDLCGTHPEMPWPSPDRLLDSLAVALGLVEPIDQSG